MTGRDTAERLDLYLAHLRAVTGEDPIIEEVEPRDPSDGRVLSLGYRDVPGPGLLTGVTYGLSLSGPGGGLTSRHEMVITLRSQDLSWASVPARAVGALRGLSPFDPGRAIGYAQRFVEESGMSSLLLGNPASSLGLFPFSMHPAESGEKSEDTVDFVGVYPIYSSEREFVKKNGFKAFWELEWSRFDPLRKPAA
ncbi:suppressor of fused domain protein [Streptomyces sp. NPDC101776]|uniref:suppressor of fused domain protein n=1 Tax=Streptomyces sp. NPDC101776 TaxID=3366146 RepID=UPI00381A32F8